MGKGLILELEQGHKAIMEAGLDKEENWTPLLLHVYRISNLTGFALGTMFGICLTMFVYLFILVIR